jgi:hypothetical protein
VPCPCCNPPYCCPSGDPSSFVYTLSGPLTGFYSEIASALIGTFVFNPTSEKPTGYTSPFYSIASDDISTFPSTASQYIGMPFDGRAWGYGGLGCGGGVPNFTVTSMVKKAAANRVDGIYTIVSLAFLSGSGFPVTGSDCFTNATNTFGGSQITALYLTYITSNSQLVNQGFRQFSTSATLTMRF